MTVLNFPATDGQPTDGSFRYPNDGSSINGVIYTWNGTYWAANNAADLTDVFDPRYVEVSGDEMTGDLKLPNLEATGDIVAAGDVQATSFNGGPLAGLRNQLINGDFRVWQRGTDFASSSSPSFNADHWRTAANRTAKRVKFAGNYGVEVTGTGGNSAYIGQPIELQGDALSGPFIEGQEYTISFTVSNSVAADVRVEMHHRIESNDNTGQQEVVPRTVVALGITATQRVSHTFTYTSAMRPTADKTCCLLEITNSVGNSTMKITQVQLECGPVATPFEQRPIGLELQLCQRYYEASANTIFLQKTGVTGTTNSLSTNVSLKTPKRATPQITVVGGTNVSGISALTFPSGSAYSFVIAGTATDASAAARCNGYTADAEL